MDTPLPFNRQSDRGQYAIQAIAFVLTYVALDWSSYIAPLHNLNLTAWNPAPALGMLFVIHQGRRAIPALFIAIVLSDVLVRDTPGNLPITLVLGALLTAGYAVISHLLKKRFPDGGIFTDRHGLLVWSALLVTGTLLNGLVFVTALSIFGLLTPGEWSEALLRFWIGDAAGAYVIMPLLWWLYEQSRCHTFVVILEKWETWGYIGLAAFTLWVAFIYGAQANFRYFYVLFLPIAWAASRQGLAGAILSIAFLQISMLGIGIWIVPEGISVYEVQVRAILLALVAFLIGVTVDDYRRTSLELRQSLRLAAAGEMAAALAHELNQPLTAMSAYAAACEKLQGGKGDPHLMQDVVRRIVGEAHRAANVVKRLRDFFRNGSICLERTGLGDLVGAATAPFAEKAKDMKVDLVVGALPPEAFLNADRLQLEVVLRNLLANALDAVADCPEGRRRISIEATCDPDNRVSLWVNDSGPGPESSMAGQIFEPFVTSKSSGLGLGLAISRAIVEAHGGTLTAVVGNHGSFRLTLPLDLSDRNVHG